jgi:hypothetical protein
MNLPAVTPRTAVMESAAASTRPVLDIGKKQSDAERLLIDKFQFERVAFKE